MDSCLAHTFRALLGVLQSHHQMVRWLQDSERAPRLRVPLGALLNQGHGTGVWVIDGDSRVRFTPVEVERLGQEFAVLSAGLEDGQRVVALGAHLLHEGDAVKQLPEGKLAGSEAARSL